MSDFYCMSIESLYFIHGFNADHIFEIKLHKIPMEDITEIIDKVDMITEYKLQDYKKSKKLFNEHFNKGC